MEKPTPNQFIADRDFISEATIQLLLEIMPLEQISKKLPKLFEYYGAIEISEVSKSQILVAGRQNKESKYDFAYKIDLKSLEVTRMTTKVNQQKTSPKIGIEQNLFNDLMLAAF